MKKALLLILGIQVFAFADTVIVKNTNGLVVEQTTIDPAARKAQLVGNIQYATDQIKYLQQRIVEYQEEIAQKQALLDSLDVITRP